MNLPRDNQKITFETISGESFYGTFIEEEKMFFIGHEDSGDFRYEWQVKQWKPADAFAGHRDQEGNWVEQSAQSRLRGVLNPFWTLIDILDHPNAFEANKDILTKKLFIRSKEITTNYPCAYKTNRRGWATCRNSWRNIQNNQN